MSGVSITPKISINETAGTAAAIAYGGDAQFNAVAALISASNGNGDNYCTGILVSPTTILSARHCDIVTNEFVRFGPDSDNPLFTSAISSFSYPAGGDGDSPLLDGGDFAIINLTTAVPASVATPLRLVNDPFALVGQEAALIGYGLSGLGTAGGNANVLRWGSRNVIDQYGGPAQDSSTATNIFSTDFDHPSVPNSLGNPTPLALEGSVARGDSGGPLLIQQNGEWLVAGVLSGGTTANGTYGDVSWWTGIDPYRTEIIAAGGVFVPEPSSSLMILLSSTLFILRRNKK